MADANYSVLQLRTCNFNYRKTFQVFQRQIFSVFIVIDMNIFVFCMLPFRVFRKRTVFKSSYYNDLARIEALNRDLYGLT